MPKITQRSEEQREFKPTPLCLWSPRSASGHKCLINIWPLNTRREPLSAITFDGCSVNREHICLASAFLSNKCLFLLSLLF